jgi:hypothetical protein
VTSAHRRCRCCEGRVIPPLTVASGASCASAHGELDCGPSITGRDLAPGRARTWHTVEATMARYRDWMANRERRDTWASIAWTCSPDPTRLPVPLVTRPCRLGWPSTPSLRQRVQALSRKSSFPSSEPCWRLPGRRGSLRTETIRTRLRTRSVGLILTATKNGSRLRATGSRVTCGAQDFLGPDRRQARRPPRTITSNECWTRPDADPRGAFPSVASKRVRPPVSWSGGRTRGKGQRSPPRWRGFQLGIRLVAADAGRTARGAPPATSGRGDVGGRLLWGGAAPRP